MVVLNQVRKFMVVLKSPVRIDRCATGINTVGDD